LPPPAAQEVRERRWHASQKLTTAPDGTVLLDLAVGGPEEVERWVLGFGPYAEVLGPSTLRARVASRLGEALAVYGPASVEASRSSAPGSSAAGATAVAPPAGAPAPPPAEPAAALPPARRARRTRGV